MEKIGRELQKSGKADRLKAVAQSEDGRRLAAMLDAAAVERAAMSGDAAALGDILRKVLSTDEGRRLARTLDETMK